MDSAGQGGVTEKLDIGGPYSSFVLDEVQIKEYSRLLRQFDAAVQRSNGSEDADEACLKSLIVLDDFIRAVAKDKNIGYSDTLEVLFNQQADGRNLSINDYLQEIVTRKTQALQQAQEQSGREGVFALLKAGGAQIVKSERVFVRTDPDRASIGVGEGQGAGEINRYAPKLQGVIQALLSAEIGGSRIYYDDLVIHPGEVDPKMVRNRPYDVIQIPKINKEIAVCEILGEVILVSPQLRGPEIYVSLNKHELENALGMQRVEYRGDWQTKLISALNDNLPEKVAKVKVEAFSKSQAIRPPRLSPAIIAIAMLKYAQIFAEGPNLPSAVMETLAPDMNETWRCIDAAGRAGIRGLTKGMSVSAIKRYYGWTDADHTIQEIKLKADLARFDATGELPKPVMTVDEAVKVRQAPSLTIEAIATSILKYVQSTAPNIKLPSQQTKGLVPNMIAERWANLEAAGQNGGRGLPKGMSVSAIKRYYGWTDADHNIQEIKLKADLAHFDATGELPKPVMTIDDAVKVREVPSLTIEAVATAMLGHAKTAPESEKLPQINSKSPVPAMPHETWRAIDASGKMGIRALPEGMSLSAIKRYYGWVDPANKLQSNKLKADLAHFDAMGELPKPVMTIEEAVKVRKAPSLTIEAIATAMLKHAKTAPESDKLPTVDSDAPVPEMPDETWKALYVAGHKGKRGLPKGMSLSAIKRYYGWVDPANKLQATKLKADLEHFEVTGELPEPVMSLEQAVLRKKAGQSSASPPNDPPSPPGHS